MNDETAREKLAAALGRSGMLMFDGDRYRYKAAAALLPVVREIAAEELREAAERVHEAWDNDEDVWAWDILRDRADALHAAKVAS